MAFGTGYAAPSSDRNGYLGFVGACLLLLAIMSMVWAGLDTSTDLRMWATLSFELFGGTIFAVLFGFNLSKRMNIMQGSTMQREAQAVVLGGFAGAIIIIIEFVVITVTHLTASLGEGVWISLMAPTAETMLAIVAVWQLLSAAFPSMKWYFKALASDIVFALFHFFHYGSDPQWLILIVVLAIGNTFLVWSYKVTKNATAPMVGHLLINLVPNFQNVLNFFYIYGPLLIIMFVVFFAIFKIFGVGKR